MHEDRSNRRLLLLLPGLLIAVFALHFRDLHDFFNFELRYVPRSPSEVVQGLISAGARRSWMHDPHVLAYLSLPLFLLDAVLLHRIGRTHRPRASLAAGIVTAVGTIYLGGLFGMWTAFYGGIAHVDPQHLAGAVATFSALTAEQGPFLMTTSLAKLAIVGIALQMLVLWNTPAIPRFGVLSAIIGCILFLAFWDLDNWMLIGSALLFVGFAAIRPSEA